MVEVPAVAIQWVIQTTPSNIELARLSNVSKRWSKEVQSFTASYPNAMMPSLLLPSLARYVMNMDEEKRHESEHPDTFCATWLHPNGIQTVPVSTSPIQTNGSHLSYGKGRARSNGENSSKHCCFEWRGYRNASQVLSPFGYSKRFVDGFMAEISGVDCSGKEEDYQLTTASVRGATFARPEAYCPCWDTNQAPSETSDASSKEVELRKYSRLIRQERLKLHHRQLLPRAIQSSLFKDPLRPLRPGKRQPSVQLLNASGSNAVRLFTPPFNCGPLSGPLTIACVAIATEDGCFLSGLKSRCEFGHLYPQREEENLIDMSPICIAIDGVTKKQDQHSKKNTGRNEDEDDSSEDTSKDEKRAYSGDSSFACDCSFNSKGELEDADAEGEEQKPPDYLYKGKRGPGEWYCYVAIIDGPCSTIRINGADESVSHFRNEAFETEELALLDGLTIGSDSSFDMPLCFGEGAIGEGDGAISELVVFQGRLHQNDIKALETHLMEKHGITATQGTRQFLQQEDEWRRSSRALIEQAAPFEMVTSGIPLRSVANDYTVAWDRTSKVTGEKINVARIGSRMSTGSSDW
eukprot:CAMPEP_0194218770 /NCGR_PEP_ID=MMETSP0156-20130528/24514_1 /TAXON_ID=33649 /ORGANISM="Thalassionema nitzschioides, Strain L26-B" /LENGTH=577 /DNA_ID=CAMNT_0038948237 /DNA_START=171 /DNA_END=1904 /DNA_ORIENTATION=+